MTPSLHRIAVMNEPESNRNADLHALEADVAYFEARLSFTAAAPDTLYQRAQQKVYEALAQHYQAELERLRKQVGERRTSD